MQDDPFDDRLRRLEERIEAARKEKDGPGGQRRTVEGSGLGWRMVTELLTGMLLGLAIGYGLDAIFGTLPVFLVVFALLGFAAGIRTMLRSAEQMQRRAKEARAQAAEGGTAADGRSAGTGDGGPNGGPRD
jgi:ATP synthase protein I